MKGNLWMEVKNERKKGLSHTEIARKHHIDLRTAKKYAESVHYTLIFNLINRKIYGLVGPANMPYESIDL